MQVEVTPTTGDGLLELKLPSQFSKYTVSEGELYVRGVLPCPPSTLAARLETQTDIAEIKGTFAAVLQSRRLGTIAIVDHLANYPLFYSQHRLTSIFADILQDDLKEDTLGTEMISLLTGHTVGAVTNRQGVFRLQPGHVLFRGMQRKYLSLSEAAHTEEEDTTKFQSIVEKVFLENVADHNILVMSAGRDSVTMAGILKKLKLLDKFDIIHIYSELQTKSEIHFVKDIAQEMDLKVHFHRQDLVDQLPEQDRLRQKCFWRENAFPLKKLAVRKFVKSGTRIWHGEIGDQLFGGPKDGIFLKMLNQLPKFDLEDMSRLWLTLANTSGHYHGTHLSPDIRYLLQDSEFASRAPDVQKAIGEIYETIQRILVNAPSKFWIERWMRVNLEIKGPFRVWGYSQCELDWFAPFAQRDVIDAALPLSITKKLGPDGRIRWIFYDLWREYVSDIPWKKSKSGISIHRPDRFR